MSHPFDALLARYVAGDCTDAEAREVERWAAEDPAHRARLEELRAIWQTAWPPAEPDIDAMWAGVRRTMRADRQRSGRFRRAFRVEARPWWRSPLAAAAAVMVAVGASLFLLRTSTHRPDGSVRSLAEYVTPRGQRATFRLSDGTQLMLAADSRLRVPADYGRGTREVYLDGEALFDVVHDAARPFRVRARHALAEDIGTRFDVRAYAEESAVAVAVAEGAVALGRADATTVGQRPREATAELVLRQGEAGTLTPDGRVTTATGAAAAAYLAWADGRLRFVKTPLADAARTIGRWYDLDVRVEGGALASLPVTAEFGMQSADELLQELALAVGARVIRSGRVVTLQPKS
jgi:transmembrane sensor